MNWIFIAILSAFFYGSYNFFIKLSSNHINQIVGAVILQIVAAIIGSVILIYLWLSKAPLSITQKGVGFAIAAGAAVGLAEITTFILFSKGVSASIGIPIIIGGSVLVGVIFGLIFTKESLGPIHIIGLILILAGIVIMTYKS